ncbi:MAG: signal peptidase I [Pseudomonadota bacterium]
MKKATENNTIEENHPVKKTNKQEMSEFAKTAVIAVLLAMAIRTFLFEPFNIPSGSMLPTLLVGDYLFVSKPAYGYSRHSFPFGLAQFDGRMAEKDPKRGDVVVFKLPSNTSVDYIKRIVGMPGDTVQMRQGRLYLNGELVEREPIGMIEDESDASFGSVKLLEYIETLPGGIMHRIYEETDNGDLDNTPLYTVPARHYFVMGDNRDNSQDSRVQEFVGFVPFENIVGRAEILFFSIDQKAQLLNPFTWPDTVRFGRMFDKIGPIRTEE